MRRLSEVRLGPNERRALEQLRRVLTGKFAVEAMILYGSAARGQVTEESDIDLLLLTSRPLDRIERHKITNVIFDVNLQFGTNFSSLVIDTEDWERGMASVLPIREEILREGIAV